MIRQTSIALVAALALAAPAALLSAPAEAGKPKTVLGLPLPPGARELGPGWFESGISFDRTIRFYKKAWKLDRTQVRTIPVYRIRGTDVARFLARDPGSPWAALHIFRARDITQVFVVPSAPLTDGAETG